MAWPVLLILVSIYAFLGVTSSFPLTIEPRHARVHPRDNVTVMCRADVEFSDCQFTWWDVDDVREGPYFDFGDGRDSDSAYLTNSSQMDWRLAGYRYEGEGLSSGQCGIQLYGVLLRYRMVGCRVRTIGGSWNYATMTICSEAKDPIELDFSPMQPVVLPGQSLAFLCKTSSPLATCKFRFPGVDVITFSNAVSPQPIARPDRSPVKWARHGKTLQQGQCGVRLLNVINELNGWVYFDAETVSGGYDRRVFYMTVAKPPAKVTMEVSKHVLVDNDYYTATCHVTESRPAANITWYMGNRFLRHDSLDDSTAENNAESPWRWNHGLHSISQTLTLRASMEDDGKILRCVVHHVGLVQPMNAITPISVRGREDVTTAPVTPISVGGIFGPVTVTCPAVPSINDVSMQCKLTGRNVNCSRPMEVGTVVRMNPRCSGENLLPRNAQYRNLTCLGSGAWDRPVLACNAGMFAPVSVTCPALPSSNDVSIQCKLTGRKVNCSRPMDVGTVARMNPRCSGENLLPRNAQYRNITCLGSGIWDRPVLACNAGMFAPVSVTCPALPSSNDVVIQCKLLGRNVNCSMPMEVGTVARMNPRCSGENLLPRNAQYRNMTCLGSGAWDRPVLACNAGCGMSKRADGRSLMVNEAPVALGEFPWHVGVYKLYNGAYEQVCAGTIISPKVILTAATCIWKITRSRNDQPINTTIFKVAAGELLRSWASQPGRNVQTRDVASVVVPERFTGVDTFFTHNVALLKLTMELDMTDSVNVVCMDWDPSDSKHDHYLAGKQGHVVGWGWAEEDSPGPVLRSVQLPHVEFATCYNLLHPGVARMLSGDVFCAGSTNDYQGYTVCESDHGSGFVIYNEHQRRYYLQGIASVAFKPVTNRETCYPAHLLSFSKISTFVEWIQSNMS